MCVQNLIAWSGDFWKGGKSQAPACSVSDKGPGLHLKQLLVFQLNLHNTCSLQNPAQVCFQNRCHFYGWPQQQPAQLHQGIAGADPEIYRWVGQFWYEGHFGTLARLPRLHRQVRQMDRSEILDHNRGHLGPDGRPWPSWSIDPLDQPLNCNCVISLQKCLIEQLFNTVNQLNFAAIQFCGLPVLLVFRPFRHFMFFWSGTCVRIYKSACSSIIMVQF